MNNYASSVADPRFPRGGGANPPLGGAKIRFLPKFPPDCMKLKEFGPGEEGVRGVGLGIRGYERLGFYSHWGVTFFT